MPPLVHPVPLYKGKRPQITSGYLPPDRPTHVGVDLLYRRDDAPGAVKLPSYDTNWFMPDNEIPALAVTDGVVVQSADIGTGGWVSIYYPSLNLTGQYAHLRRRKVKVGEAVLAKQPVGFISYNPLDRPLSHLHFQLRAGNMGELMDPAPFIATLTPVPNPLAWQQQLLAAAVVGLGGYVLFKLAQRSGAFA